MKKIAALALTTSMFLLAGCDSPAQPEPPLLTVVTTVESTVANADAEQPAVELPPVEQPAVEPEAAPAPPAPPAPSDSCGVDTGASAIYNNISQVPRPSNYPNGTWEFRGQTNYNPCADLSYAVLVHAESTHALRATQLMLFHQGEYLGVGALVDAPFSIVGSDNSTVTVAYRDSAALSAAGASNAEASNYTTNVTFAWNGSKVVPTGRFPQ